ncbi:hypothetical protein [Owariibacterium komagatae]
MKKEQRTHRKSWLPGSYCWRWLSAQVDFSGTYPITILQKMWHWK